MCTTAVEDELHVVLQCILYEDFHDSLFEPPCNTNTDFTGYDDLVQFVLSFQMLMLLNILTKPAD